MEQAASTGRLGRSLSPQGTPVTVVGFHTAECRVCPTRTLCTQAKAGARELTLRPRDHHAALFAARLRQTTTPFKKLYAVSNHPPDQAEVVLTLENTPPKVGTPDAAALDTGCFSATNIRLLPLTALLPSVIIVPVLSLPANVAYN